MRYVLTYPATLLIFVAMDAVWLTMTGTPLYRATLGDMLLESPRWVPAIAFYLLYVVSIMVFVIPIAVRSQSMGTALLYGVVFGVIGYATYDLTNYATLRVWSLQLTVLDMIWGGVVTGVASALGYRIGDALLRLTASPG